MASERTAGRELILAKATRLFARQGYEGTSVQDVADAVGVTKQGVLHHYASKEELRRAVVDATLSHWNEALPRLLLAATAAGDRFDAVFGELWRFFAQDEDRARLFVRELLDRPEELKRLLRGPVRPWLEAVAGYIRAGREGGRHHGDLDPEAYVVTTLMAVISTVAARSVMGAALAGAGEAGEAGEDEAKRIEHEVRRMARSALFVGAQGPRDEGEKPRKTRGNKG